MPSSLSSLINLSNSIIGVSLLTMPYCFQQCGILLSFVVLVLSAIVNKYACHLLLKAAMLTRRRKLEYLAYQTLGYNGKLLIELGLIFFLLGGCVALFVVAGDLLPALLSSGVAQESRVYLMVFLAFFVALPLSLRRNTESLTSFSLIAMMFYVFLAIKMFLDSLPALVNGNWFHRVVWWNTDNLLAILPIFAMALAGQPQVFEVFDLGAVDVLQMRVLDRTVSSAMHTCLTVYTVVGFCGYIGQYQRQEPLPGNSLLLLDDSWLSWMFKLGFVASLIMSFPLCLFPCRTSLHSVIYRRNAKLHEASSSLHDFIPENRFKLLTFVLLASTLGAALLIPRIELFLGITGATIGCVVCLVAPARIFLGAANGKNQTNALEGFMAQFVVFLGLIIMALCSFSMINRLHQPEAFRPSALSNTDHIADNAHLSKDFPLQAANTDQQLKIVTSQSKVEIKPPIVGKEHKSSEFQNEIHKIKTIANKTIPLVDTGKYRIGTNKANVVSSNPVLNSRGGDRPNSSVPNVKPMNKPNIATNIDKINVVTENQPLAEAEAVKESQKPLPAISSTSGKNAGSAPRTAMPSLPGSARVGRKNDKDEIKLLEKIAEVQQEQKKMIEDIQKELKQEIALHKEIKANHSKENEIVELFEEKMKRIDKHIQEVDKIGNKTLKDVIETENIQNRKIQVQSIKETAEKQKPLEFKGPLKILNNRIEQTIKDINGPAPPPARYANDKVAMESTNDKLPDANGQRSRHVEVPSITLKKNEIKDSLGDLSNNAEQDVKGGILSHEKEIVQPKKIPLDAQPSSLQSASNILRKRAHSPETISPVEVRLPENGAAAATVEERLEQNVAEIPKKAVVIPIEKPALLSEVTKDQGPALMKDLDKSFKQDKQQRTDDERLPVGIEINNDEVIEKNKKNKVDMDNSRRNKSQEQFNEKHSAVVDANERVSEVSKMSRDHLPKVATAPLALKMQPAMGNTSKKETVHKEI